MIEDFQLTPLEPLKLKISSFVREFEFLSNFYPVSLVYEGLIYPSVEHAFQATKFHQKELKFRIRDCQFAGQAKRLGKRFRSVRRPDWLQVCDDCMLDLLRMKFPHPQDAGGSRLSNLLINTGGRGVDRRKHLERYLLGSLSRCRREHVGRTAHAAT